MKSFDGYLKLKLGNDYVLLAGGNHKALSDFSMNNHTHSNFVYNSVLDPNIPALFGYYGNANNPSPYYANGDGGYLQVPTYLHSHMGYLYSAIMRWDTGGNVYMRNIADGVISNWKQFAFTSDLPGIVSKTANGLCPALPDENITTKFLRLDGSWQVPPDNNTLYYLTLNGTVNGTNNKVNLGTFYAVATSDASAKDLVWMRNSNNTAYGWRTLGSNAFNSNSYSLTGHTHPYTDITGSGTTADLALVSTTTVNTLTFKQLGSSAFVNTDTFIRIITTSASTSVNANSFTQSNTLYNTNTNLDLTSSIVYNFPTSRPSGGYWVLSLNLNGAYRHQLYGCNIDEHIYVRSISNGNQQIWFNWLKLAFTSDLPTKSSWNYDDRYVTAVGVGGSGHTSELYYKLNGNNYYFTCPYANSAGSVAWANVSAKPETATRWPSWSEVTGKPDTFPPSSHSHNYVSNLYLNIWTASIFGFYANASSIGNYPFMNTGDAGYLIIPTFSNNTSGYYYSCIIRVSIGGKLTYKHVNNGTDSGFLTLIDTGGGLTINGNLTAVNFYTTSDARKKQNIHKISDNIKQFEWKETGETSYGFVAQDLEVKHPELVNDDGNMKTVNYNAALSLVVAKLENRVKELEAKLGLETPPCI